MSRIAKLRGLGMFLGISTAIWLTLLGQWVVVYQSSVPFGLAFPIFMLWRIVMVAPAYLLAHAVGWHWGGSDALSAGQLVMVMAVNVVLWGLAGMIPAMLLKSRVSSKLGSKVFIVLGLGLLVAGCIFNDGLWLRNLGLFALMLGAVVPIAYSLWFRTSATAASQSTPSDLASSGDITRATVTLNACSWFVIGLGIAITAWFYSYLWAFLPYVFFGFANIAARQTIPRVGVLALSLFCVCGSSGWFWHAAFVNYYTLHFKLIGVVIGESLLAGVAWFVVRRIERTTLENAAHR